MKYLILLLVSIPAFAQNLWKKIDLTEMVIEVPVHRDGSIDRSRMQRRMDDPATATATLTPNKNPLWPVTRHWTEVDEDGYAAWVKKDVKENFFVGSGVPVDCADAAIALRWIYARENGLPAAQSLAGSGTIFGQAGSADEWDVLPRALDWRADERFKAALRYLLSHIYTHSILNDLYPVEITPAYLTAGTIHLGLFGSSGHTRTLVTVAPGYLEFIYGNLPASEYMFQDENYVFWQPPHQGGFLRFRWPEDVNGQWVLRDKDKMPGYSTEQYDWAPHAFEVKLNERLKLWNTIQDQIIGTAAHLVRLISERMHVVFNGYYQCSVVPCAPGSELDNEHSTPQRDHRMSQIAKSLGHLFNQLSPNDPLFGELKTKYGEALMPGAALTYFDLFSESEVLKLKSDPTVSVFERWNIPDTQDLNSFLIRAWTLNRNFKMRDTLVFGAVIHCFPNGESSPQCDPSSEQILKLDTTRLDAAFRLDRQAVLGVYNQLSPADQGVAQRVLAGWGDLCWLRPSGVCSTMELLTTDMIDKMTSSPLDSAAARYGAP